MLLSYLASSSGEDECRRRLPKVAKLLYLDLLLIRTNGTPVVNMQAKSPPPLLTVNYFSKDCIATDDEKGMVFALE